MLLVSRIPAVVTIAPAVCVVTSWDVSNLRILRFPKILVHGVEREHRRGGKTTLREWLERTEEMEHRRIAFRLMGGWAS